MDSILVTGGAGFIGSSFILLQLRAGQASVVNLDCLNYAANPKNLDSVAGDPRYVFIHGDIGDGDMVRSVLQKFHPRAVVNFAAESHVDRSIDSPEAFIRTNVLGTFQLLEQTRCYWEGLSGDARDAFRFLHVSTDEVYGTLGASEPAFTEITPYAPNSPYAATKASSDHLVRAYRHTYGLPALVTNCSNNYGPRQFPEKLVPLIIMNAVEGKPLPVYGDGSNIRDWLFVEDHCEALRVVLARGRVGETYNIGGHCETTNLDMVRLICGCLDKALPGSPFRPHASLIRFVQDRPGHDWRYAVNCSKIERELCWAPKETLESGLRKTIQWYLSNPEWTASIKTGEYREWIKRHYGAA